MQSGTMHEAEVEGSIPSPGTNKKCEKKNKKY